MAVFFACQAIDDLLHACHREPPEIISFQSRTPGVKNLYSLRASFDLRVKIFDRCFGCDIHQVIENFRCLFGQGLDCRKLAAGAAFHHVRTDCEWAACETDQWHLAIQFTTYSAHRVKNVAELFFNVRDSQALNGVGSLYRALKLWPFSGLEIEAKPHRVRNRQNIGKQNRGVQLVAPERLHRYFARELRVFAQAKEIARLSTRCAIFRQVTSGLTHDPHGCS